MMLDNCYPARLLPYSAVLDRFGPGYERQGHWYAECPACAKPGLKLTFWVGRGGQLMFGCWRGCAKGLILRTVGLDMARCWPGKDAERFNAKATANYDYLDHSGKLVYRVVRLEWDGADGRKKRFVQCRPDPANAGKFVFNLTGVERVLYRLPQLLRSDQSSTVLVVEGEKDVLTAEQIGFLATTAAGGAKAEWLASYSEVLSGRHVVVVPDADEAGLAHAQRVAGSLLWHDAASVRLAGLPAKDLTGYVGELRHAGINGLDAIHSAVARKLSDAAQWGPRRKLARTA